MTRYYAKEAQRLHQERINELKRNPSLMGIEFFVNAIIECPLFEGKNEVGSIDVVVARQRDLFVVEYKLNDEGAKRKKAEEQLLKARRIILTNKSLFEPENDFGRNWMRKYCPELTEESIRLLHVYGHFITEEYMCGEFVRTFQSKERAIAPGRYTPPI